MREEFVVQRFALGAKLSRAVSIGIVPRSRPVTCSRGMSPTKAARQTGLRTLDALPRHPKRGIMPESLEYDLEQIL